MALIGGSPCVFGDTRDRAETITPRERRGPAVLRSATVGGAMKSRVPLSIAIPQTFVGRPVDVGLVRDFLVRAEALGFEGAWVVEQVLGGIPSLEAVDTLTYAAALTRRLKLGTAVLLTGLRSPVHLAKSLATL